MEKSNGTYCFKPFYILKVLQKTRRVIDWSNYSAYNSHIWNTIPVATLQHIVYQMGIFESIVCSPNGFGKMTGS